MSWILTNSGTSFDFNYFCADDVDIYDVAHALSHQCRYNGHCREFYSVAQHSVLVAEHVSREHRLCALLHDAPEAYIGDLPSPLKEFLPDYVMFEQKIWSLFAEKYALPRTMPAEVEQADRNIIVDEMAVLFDSPPRFKDRTAIGVHITPWSQEKSYDEFMEFFEELTYN